jgi:hypothetical protein
MHNKYIMFLALHVLAMREVNIQSLTACLCLHICTTAQQFSSEKFKKYPET